MMKKTLRIISIMLSMVIFLSIILLAVVVGASDENESTRHSVNVLVPPTLQFNEVRSFSGGLAGVRNNNSEWGFIDKHGQVIIPFTYYTDVGSFTDGLAWVQDGRKYGFINKVGEVVVPLEYEDVKPFADGVAIVRKEGGSHDTWRYGLINKAGVIVLPLEYNSIGSFTGGLAKIEKDGKFGYVDNTGRVVISPEYDEVGAFVEGLARAKKGGKWGYINDKGVTLVSFEYEEVSLYADDLAAVKQSGMWGYVNKSGVLVIPMEFDTALEFSEGYAVVSKPSWFSVGALKWYGVIDKTGTVIFQKSNTYFQSTYSDGLIPFTSGMMGTKRGFIDISGNVVISNIYDSASDFANGTSLVKLGGKYGYIDKTGNVVMPIEYDNIYTLLEDSTWTYDRITVNKNGKWGMANPKTGSLILPIEYDYSMGNFFDGLSRVRKDGLYEYVNKSGSTIVSPKYDYARDFNDGLAVVGNNEKYGLINSVGTVVLSVEYDRIYDFSDNLAWVVKGGKYGIVGKNNSGSIAGDTSISFEKDVFNVPIGKTIEIKATFSSTTLTPNEETIQVSVPKKDNQEAIFCHPMIVWDNMSISFFFTINSICKNGETYDVFFDTSDGQRFNIKIRVYSEFMKMFEKKSTEYNQQAAVSSAELSQAAYSKGNIQKELEDMGFDKDDINVNSYDEIGALSADQAAHAFAHKNVLINGDETTVFIVAIRGTPPTAEWITTLSYNLIPFSTIHDGINIVKKNLATDLEGYIKQNKGKNNKILFTGHSRGASIANLLASEYTKEATGKDSLFGKEDIYAYTFATLNVTQNSEVKNKSAFNNINNFVFVDDPAGYYPSSGGVLNSLFGIGYWKYGTTYVCPNNYDKLFEFPWNAHEMTRYLSKMKSINGKDDLSSSMNLIIARVACPVDVEVYSKEGKLVGKIINNKIHEEVKGNLLLFVEGDVKYVYMFPGNIYTLKLIGKDNGKMKFSIIEAGFDSSSIIAEKHFTNVSLTKGKEMSSIVNTTSDVKLNLVKNGKIIGEIAPNGKETFFLSKPTKLKLTCKKATWKKVKCASGYTLKIFQLGKTKAIKTVQIKKGKTSYKISKKLFKKGKKYYFGLVAKGKGKYKNSKMAKSKVVKIKN